MEDWSTHQLKENAIIKLGSEKANDLQKYTTNLKIQSLPVIFTLNHLGIITNTEYSFLYKTVCREREYVNYRMFPIKKRSGGTRFIHAVSKKLSIVQTFINNIILQSQQPHNCSYAYHPSGGIKKCAAMHCNAKWLFQFDLADFFYRINEIDVYNIFQRMGYRKLLSFELARLCTTIRLPRQLQSMLKQVKSFSLDDYPFYNNDFIGVLPQGSPTSPMLSNLAAMELDEDLYVFALKNGFIYTRYADDLTFSAINLPQGMSIGKIRWQIIQIIRKNCFKENSNKIRIAGPGAKKIVLGLLVDGNQPRISKEMYKRIEKIFYYVNRFKFENTAKHLGFNSTFGLINHLLGLISYLKDVDSDRYGLFNKKFNELMLSLGC
ncbi:MAG: reverse transcriptase family protein [Deltaproteobacteria bacterium]|nr:reverse transcriptase family protein [Deltaproteobacteria bacterium]